MYIKHILCLEDRRMPIKNPNNLKIASFLTTVGSVEPDFVNHTLTQTEEWKDYNDT